MTELDQDAELTGGPPADRTPVIVRFVERPHHDLDAVAHAPAWALTAEQVADAARDVRLAESRLAALRLVLLAQADRMNVAAATADSSTAAWWQETARVPRRAAFQQLRLARALDDGHHHTAAALAEGRLDPEQAAAVVDAVDRLPATVPVSDRERGEAHLVAASADLDAQRLRLAGRRLRDVLDPDGADEREGHRLADEERRARRSTFLELFDNGDGTYGGRFRIPTLYGAMLTKMVWAAASPRRRAALGAAGDSRYESAGRALRRPETNGVALCELLQRMQDADLPHASGAGATVVVTMSLDQLEGRLGAARLDTGQRISAGDARRMACSAGVLPLVLGGASQALDLGRRRRLHSKAQRIAMIARDQTCTATGCERPSAWCEVHHDGRSWADGGTTTVEGGRLLCSWHHHRAHDAAYDMHHLPDGTVRFTRRT